MNIPTRRLRLAIFDRGCGGVSLPSQIDDGEVLPRYGEWGGCGFDCFVEAMLFAADTARPFVQRPDWSVSVEFFLEGDAIEYFLGGGCLGPRLN